MLTKQLQVLIDVSLSSGRSFDDIRNILQIQGYSDEAVDRLFESYRASGQAQKGYTQKAAVPDVVVPAAPAPAPVSAVPTAPPEFSQAFAAPTAPAAPVAPAAATPPPAKPVDSFDVVPAKVLPGASYVADFMPSAAVVDEQPTEPISTSESMTLNVSPDFAPRQMAASPVAAADSISAAAAMTPPSPAMAAMSPEAAAAYAKSQLHATAVPSAIPTVASIAKPAEREAPIIMPHRDGIADRQSTAPLRVGYEAGSIMPPSQMNPEGVMPHNRSQVATTANTAVSSAAPSAPVQPTLTNVPRAGAINVGLGGIPELENAALEDYKRKQAKSPVPAIIMLVTVVILIGGFAYWFFMIGPGAAKEVPSDTVGSGATPDLVDDVATTPTTPATSVDIDPFTGAPRLPDAPITPINVPTTTVPVAATCGPFTQNLKIGDTGSGVVTLQAHFEAIGVFAQLGEYTADNDTFVNGAKENGVFNAYLQQAVRFYQSVVFDGSRGVSGVQQGAIDPATRAALAADCDGTKFATWYTEIRDYKRDVKVQSLLGNARLAIYAYADEKGTYEGMCDESRELVDVLEQVDAITTSRGAVICTTAPQAFVIAAPLFGSTGYYCMDGAKNSLQVEYVSTDQLTCK